MAEGATLDELRAAREDGLLVFLLAERTVDGGRRAPPGASPRPACRADVRRGCAAPTGCRCPTPTPRRSPTPTSRRRAPRPPSRGWGSRPSSSSTSRACSAAGWRRRAEVMRATGSSSPSSRARPRSSSPALRRAQRRPRARCSARCSSRCCACTCATRSGPRRSAPTSAPRARCRRARGRSSASPTSSASRGSARRSRPRSSARRRAPRALAGDVVEPPVRLVKTIGDAVMLVSPESTRSLDVALHLDDAAAAGRAFPQLRVGVAGGPAVAPQGDWYGRPVNLASRVTASRGPAACSPRARSATRRADAVRWSAAGARTVKGRAPGAARLVPRRGRCSPDARRAAAARADGRGGLGIARAARPAARRRRRTDVARQPGERGEHARRRS